MPVEPGFHPVTFAMRMPLSPQEQSGSPLPERVRAILEQRPSQNTAIFYQAVVLALGIHVFVVALIYFSTAMPDMAEEQRSSEEPLEQFDLLFEEPEKLEAELQDPASAAGNVRDLVAGARSQRTSSAVNYTGKTQEQIEAEVNAQLRGLEQSEFDRLRSQHSEVVEENPEQASADARDKKNTQKDQEDRIGAQSDKSFSGPVSAEFDLAGRSTRSAPRPMYRCPTPGKVVVDIEVDPTGQVTQVIIREGESSPDECIRAEARNYARNWKFDYNTKAPKKQRGSISFTFRGQ